MGHGCRQVLNWALPHEDSFLLMVTSDRNNRYILRGGAGVHRVIIIGVSVALD